MQLLIPDEAIADASLTEKDLLRELAIALYQRGKITLGHGCKMTHLSEIAFQRLLDSYNITLRYPEHTLDDDLKTIAFLSFPRWSVGTINC